MDSLILGLRVLVALGAVLGLMWILHRRLGKGTGKRRAARDLTVVSRQGVGQKASVVVVDALGQRFLLGVTEQAVRVLHRGDIPDETDDEPPRAQATFAMPDESPSASDFADALAAANRPRRSSIHRDQGRAALHGSILAGSTWRQAAAVLKGGRGN